MLNFKKIVVLIIIVQQLIANRHPEQSVTYSVIYCVYYTEMQSLYIISKFPTFCSDMPSSVS